MHAGASLLTPAPRAPPRDPAPAGLQLRVCAERDSQLFDLSSRSPTVRRICLLAAVLVAFLTAPSRAVGAPLPQRCALVCTGS